MSKSTGCRNEPSTSENDTMTMRMRFLFAALTLALAAGSCSREPRTELFNGRDLAGWVCVTDPEGVGDARDAFSVQNGNIRIAGSPFGYMRTEETYDDYRLHVEWRWIGEATNSGIFQRVQAGDRLWPEAVECQLQAGRAGDLLGLGGAKIARSAGAAVQLVAKDGAYAQLRMPSGEIRNVDARCRATIGEVGNSEHANIQLGKAGRARWMGKRPWTRGESMNPVDHPHGGRTRGGKPPVSPWGKGEVRTRRPKKASNKMIVRRRPNGKNRK